MSAWDTVRRHIERQDAAAVAALVVKLDRDDRRAIAAELPGYLSGLRAHALVEEWATPLRVAGAGTIGGAAGVASWLHRRDLAPQWGLHHDTELLLDVLSWRSTPWLEDLATRAALRIRDADDPGVPLALALLRRTGVTPPAHDPLVVAWVAENVTHSAAALAADPLLGALLPRLFEAEGVGRRLQHVKLAPVSPPKPIPGATPANAVPPGSADPAANAVLPANPARPTGHTPPASAATARPSTRPDAASPPWGAALGATSSGGLSRGGSSPGSVQRPTGRSGVGGGTSVGTLGGGAVGVGSSGVPVSMEELGEGAAVDAGLSGGGAGEGWLDGFRDLAAATPDTRRLLLDGCVSRFLRGGAPQDLRFFARLHEALAPSSGEVEPCLRDYLRLLPSAAAPAAKVALTRLRAAEPDPATVTEALEAVLFRAESGLVRSGLTWLDQTLRHAKDRADELVPSLAMALGHRSRAVQEHATRVALKHAPRFSPLAAETIRTAGELLPPSLSARLAEGYGGEVVPQEPFTPAGLPPLPVPDDFPDIPATPKALAATFHRSGWAAAERFMAGFVRLAASDRAGLQAALESVVTLDDRYTGSLPETTLWFHDLAVELVRPRRVLKRRRPWLTEPASAAAPPFALALRRCAEIHEALRTGTLPPLLLATPTRSDGRLDPWVFLDRLEAVGEPLPADFQQALLRLPRRIPAEAVERASGLTSAAGRTAAAWLTGGGLADPVSTVTTVVAENRLYWNDPAHQIVSSLEGTPTGLAEIDALARGTWHDALVVGAMDWWPGMLPSHREVLAAHLVPRLSSRWAVTPARWLEAIVRADGPAGPATALLVARALVDPQSRDEAVSALRRLAAAGAVPSAALARRLKELVGEREASLKAVADVLELAARKGAHVQVWEVFAELVPLLLPAAGARPMAGLAYLVERAGLVAGWAGARGEVRGLAAVAAGRGSSRFVTEARRLHTILTA
ncbi:hypothetical protein ACFXJ8_23250 [Nonomuraea sp. NPDC059194]|uniref:hypothetical protein n=1 Tax=Nonomuraea sp. NPDC059194 TaxID=3346764 RepID=UPI0036A045CE